MLHSLRDHMGPAAAGPDIPRASRRLRVHRWHQIQPVLSGRYLVKGALPATGVSATFGHSVAGKTFLVVDQAMHVALGWDWFGRKTTRAGVVYVAAEGGMNLANRIEAFKRHHDIGEEVDVPFLLIPETVDLFQKDVGALLETIREESRNLLIPVGLVVVDTVSKTMGGGKENTDDLATYVANCEKMANELGAHVLLVHHRPKDSENRSLRERTSGAGNRYMSGWLGKASVVAFLDDEAEGDPCWKVYVSTPKPKGAN